MPYSFTEWSFIGVLTTWFSFSLQKGIPVTDPKFYSKVTLEELKNILKSDTDVECPLIEERLRCLHEVGTVLLEKYNGSFVNCIKECDHSAQKLLALIVSNFSCFRDVAVYNGQKGKHIEELKRSSYIKIEACGKS